MLGRSLQGGNLSAAALSSASNIATGANTATVLTIAAVAGKRILVNRVYCSYSAAPTGGKLTITGSGVSFEVDIIVGGPTVLDVNYLGTVNTNVVLTLAAGAGAVVGKLNADYTLE